jgi:predicted membrane chloride channel (bestrophin family)
MDMPPEFSDSSAVQVRTPHPSHYCLLVISHALERSGLDAMRLARLQECLSTLYASLYTCDRILNTPIPLSYTR